MVLIEELLGWLNYHKDGLESLVHLVTVIGGVLVATWAVVTHFQLRKLEIERRLADTRRDIFLELASAIAESNVKVAQFGIPSVGLQSVDSLPPSLLKLHLIASENSIRQMQDFLASWNEGVAEIIVLKSDALASDLRVTQTQGWLQRIKASYFQKLEHFNAGQSDPGIASPRGVWHETLPENDTLATLVEKNKFMESALTSENEIRRRKWTAFHERLLRLMNDTGFRAPSLLTQLRTELGVRTDFTDLFEVFERNREASKKVVKSLYEKSLSDHLANLSGT